MFAQHPAAKSLQRLGAFTPPVILDSAADAKKQALLDDATAAALTSFAMSDIKLSVAASLQEWVATASDDLLEGETMADRLFALMVGIADDDKDGEITEDEQAVITLAMESAYDIMVAKGVTEDDALAALNEGDSEATGRILELLKDSVPEGDDGAMDEVDSFAFDAESSESVLDGVLDAVYKKRVVVRKGRKVRINKRVSGTVRLNASQKVAIRKAGRKAHSAVAKMRRAKSMRIRSRSGL